MTELIFEVRESVEGGFEARALGTAIFTEGDSLEEIRSNVQDAVRCHFDPNSLPKSIRLIFIREEVLAA